MSGHDHRCLKREKKTFIEQKSERLEKDVPTFRPLPHARLRFAGRQNDIKHVLTELPSKDVKDITVLVRAVLEDNLRLIGM